MTGARRRLALVAVALAAFVTALDNTVVVVALPAIGTDLGLGRTGLEWVGASYLLTFAGLLLPGGRLCDLWGRRPALVAGTAGFVLASAAAAWSPTGAWLIGSRAAQGVGGALLLPAALAVLAADLDPAARRLAAGIWTAAIAVALSVGPLAGGFATQVGGWRWVFLINVPVGLVLIAVVLITLPRRTEPAAAGGPDGAAGGGPGWRALDLPGLITSAVGLLALTGALVEWNARGGGVIGVRVAVVVAAVSWAAFVVVERRSAHPLVPGSLWRQREFTGGTGAQVLWGLGINGILFFTSMYLQGVLGLGPTAAGAVFVPVAAAVALAVVPAGRLVDRFGAAAVVAGGMVLVAAGLVAVALADPSSRVAGVLPGLVILGAGSGLTTPLTDAVLGVVPADRAGVASAVVSAAREMSGALGIAVVGLVLTVVEGSERGAGRAPREAFLTGYRAGLAIAAAVVLGGGAVAWTALRPRDVSGGRDLPGFAAARGPVEPPFRALVHACADVVAIVDHRGMVSYASPAARRVLGVRPALLAGTPLALLFDDDRQDELRRLLARARAGDGGTVLRWEAPYRIGDAERRLEFTVDNHMHDPQLRGLLVQVRDVTARPQRPDGLLAAAAPDRLTGLLRPQEFRGAASRLLAGAREGSGVVVVHGDLDGLTPLTDDAGHPAGDEVLAETARRVSRAVRSTDLVCRMAGDGFALALAGVPDARAAGEIESRLAAAVARPVRLRDGLRVRVRAGLGSQFTAHPEPGIDELLIRADLAKLAPGRSGGRASPRALRDRGTSSAAGTPRSGGSR